VEENHIYKKEILKIDNLNSKIINHLFKDIYSKHIFLSGYFKKDLRKIKEIFYSSGIKVHIFNI